MRSQKNLLYINWWRSRSTRVHLMNKSKYAYTTGIYNYVVCITINFRVTYLKIMILSIAITKTQWIQSINTKCINNNELFMKVIWNWRLSNRIVVRTLTQWRTSGLKRKSSLRRRSRCAVLTPLLLVVRVYLLMVLIVSHFLFVSK